MTMPSERHCSYCDLPAVCIGAELATTIVRCPRCCRLHGQFGGPHGPDEYLQSHFDAEGIDYTKQSATEP